MNDRRLYMTIHYEMCGGFYQVTCTHNLAFPQFGITSIRICYSYRTIESVFFGSLRDASNNDIEIQSMDNSET